MIKKYLPFFQRNMPPILNAMIVIGVGIIFSPFQPLPPKLFIILLFLLYNLGCFFLNKNRDIGMAMVGAYWKQQYPKPQQILYIALYTLSFASIFYHIFFPFDLLLFNIVLLQVPTLLFSGMTFPAFLAGRMQIVAGKPF
ncbi:MAG: hypothetical protein ABSE91_02775 [Patescibacteria group bacterium]